MAVCLLLTRCTAVIGALLEMASNVEENRQTTTRKAREQERGCIQTGRTGQHTFLRQEKSEQQLRVAPWTLTSAIPPAHPCSCSCFRDR
ncbi:hypothetical protein BD289DRAFT_445624 [Coniella lustricola]|uniref:Secreted protein n=1 Tax=Coniella lustricola TaxID=2025994 RepID=A0A2T2ZUU2_9PEZI|nr:hypothetical protein BD289DRAFT_445624 [Coniella lustricola]